MTRGHLQLVEEVTGRRPEGIVFANGAQKPGLSQIMADVLAHGAGSRGEGGDCLGAALCAGVAAGVYDNMEDAVRRTVWWDASYEPVTENRKVYDDLYDKWRALYGAQLKLADEGVTAHMAGARRLIGGYELMFKVNESEFEYRFGDSGPKYLMKAPHELRRGGAPGGQDFRDHLHNVMEENFFILEGS